MPLICARIHFVLLWFCFCFSLSLFCQASTFRRPNTACHSRPILVAHRLRIVRGLQHHVGRTPRHRWTGGCCSRWRCWTGGCCSRWRCCGIGVPIVRDADAHPGICESSMSVTSSSVLTLLSSVRAASVRATSASTSVKSGSVTGTSAKCWATV